MQCIEANRFSFDVKYLLVSTYPFRILLCVVSSSRRPVILSSCRPVDMLSAWSHTNAISAYVYIHIHNLISHLRPTLRERL
jgi:hypothetical protein